MKQLIVNQEMINSLSQTLADTIICMKEFDVGDILLYGVPRGGIPVVYLMLQYSERFKITDTPAYAHVIIDDLIDSGKTESYYLKHGHKFMALIDKRIDGICHGRWVVFPWERTDEDDKSASDIPLRFLQYINEDPTRDGLIETPERVVKSWDELYSGYGKNVSDVVKVFDNDGEEEKGYFVKYDQMVILKDIEFYSTCEHHILPFYGKIHIGYVPNKKVIGISKLSRVVEIFARRLQIQERLTQQIADGLQETLDPKGMIVFCEAVHLCMLARGVKKQNATMITSAITGVYSEDKVRNEFFNLIKRG